MMTFKISKESNWPLRPEKSCLFKMHVFRNHPHSLWQPTNKCNSPKDLGDVGSSGLEQRATDDRREVLFDFGIGPEDRTSGRVGITGFLPLSIHRHTKMAVTQVPTDENIFLLLEFWKTQRVHVPPRMKSISVLVMTLFAKSERAKSCSRTPEDK